MDKMLNFGSSLQRLLVIFVSIRVKRITRQEGMWKRRLLTSQNGESSERTSLCFCFQASPPKLIKLCFCTSSIQPWGQSHHILSNSRKTSLWAFLPLLSYSVKYFLFPFENATVVCSLKYDLSSWDIGSGNIHHVYPKFSRVSGHCDWFRNTYLIKMSQ